MDAQKRKQVEAADLAFLAARLRRLFAHFNYPLPAFAADDARLIGIAGSVIGGLLTRWETAQPIAWVNGDDLHNKANATIACGAERRYVNGHAYDTPLYLDAALSLIREEQAAPPVAQPVDAGPSIAVPVALIEQTCAVLDEAMAYTGSAAFSPSMTAECASTLAALRRTSKELTCER
jgi:hypothetical protein